MNRGIEKSVETGFVHDDYRAVWGFDPTSFISPASLVKGLQRRNEVTAFDLEGFPLAPFWGPAALDENIYRTRAKFAMSGTPARAVIELNAARERLLDGQQVKEYGMYAALLSPTQLALDSVVREAARASKPGLWASPAMGVLLAKHGYFPEWVWAHMDTEDQTGDRNLLSWNEWQSLFINSILHLSHARLMAVFPTLPHQVQVVAFSYLLMLPTPYPTHLYQQMWEHIMDGQTSWAEVWMSQRTRVNALTASGKMDRAGNLVKVEKQYLSDEMVLTHLAHAVNLDLGLVSWLVEQTNLRGRADRQDAIADMIAGRAYLEGLLDDWLVEQGYGGFPEEMQVRIMNQMVKGAFSKDQPFLQNILSSAVSAV